jgi:hypothetical protein
MRRRTGPTVVAIAVVLLSVGSCQTTARVPGSTLCPRVVGLGVHLTVVWEVCSSAERNG